MAGTGRLTTRGVIVVQDDGNTISDDVKTIDFGTDLEVIDNGDGNVTVRASITAGDPFNTALFDICEPLFDKDENGIVMLLQECG